MHHSYLVSQPLLPQSSRRFLTYESIHHSVGQGLMHSGIIRDCQTQDTLLTTVYDCGSASGTKANQHYYINREVTLLKKRTDKIDFLFISHFDNDHVNGLPLLLRDFTPRFIIIPGIPASERLFQLIHTNLHKPSLELSPKVKKIIANPVNALRSLTNSDSQIIEINENTELVEVPKYQNELNGDLAYRISPPTLRSHHAMLTFGPDQVLWILQPWLVRSASNQMKKVFRSFENAVKIDKKRSLDDQLGEILEDIDIHLNRIKNAYQTAIKTIKSSDVINFTSLCLYSGPPSNSAYYTNYQSTPNVISQNVLYPFGYNYYSSPDSFSTAPGWIGTGDATLKVMKTCREFVEFYNLVSRNVGQITAPHHGSRQNIHPMLINKYTPNIEWIISAGDNSSYGHPHPDVIDNIRKAGGRVIRTNEKAKSRYIKTKYIGF